jgi:Tat protein translocase TatB subunit
MFGTLGGPEIFLILVVALIVFGPRKLPEIGKSVGKMLAEFRKASNDFKRTIEDEVEAERLRDLDASRTPPSPPPPATESPRLEEQAPPAVSREETPPPPIEPK